MKKSIAAILPLLMVFGCKEIVETPQKNITNSYLQVSCENCQVGYGMPDQYKAFDNAGGLSSKFPYTYKEGYNLQIQITPVGKPQELTLKVYDIKGNILYNGIVNKEASAKWGVSVLLLPEQ